MAKLIRDKYDEVIESERLELASEPAEKFILLKEKIAEELKEETPGFTVDENGVIVPVEGNEVAETTVVQVEKFKDSVTGLQQLNSELQASAGSLALKILEASRAEDLSTNDLRNLSSALTSIQTAFFTKPTTNIQVNNVNAGDESSSLLDKFRENQKS